MKRNTRDKRTWDTLKTKVVYRSQIISVREDEVIKPDGSVGTYSFVQIPRTVGVVPLDKEKNVYLCRQYRYIFKDFSWEIPRGFIENGETPLEAAKRELREEAAVDSKNLIILGKLRASIGLIDEEVQIFLARGVTPVPNEINDKSFEIESMHKIPLREVLAQISTNKIIDGLTVAAILKAVLFLNFK